MNPPFFKSSNSASLNWFLRVCFSSLLVILSAPPNVSSKYSRLVESGDLRRLQDLTERHTGGALSCWLTNLGVGKPGGDERGRTLTQLMVDGGEGVGGPETCGDLLEGEGEMVIGDGVPAA